MIKTNWRTFSHVSVHLTLHLIHDCKQMLHLVKNIILMFFLIQGFQMVCIQLFGCQLVRFLKQAPEATQTLTILLYPYSLLLILSIHFSVKKVSKVVTT